MRKPIMAIIAAGAIAAATVSAPKPAEARCWGCWAGVGIAAGLSGGAIIASNAYAYGYGPYYGYPAYYAPYALCAGLLRLLLALLLWLWRLLRPALLLPALLRASLLSSLLRATLLPPLCALLPRSPLLSVTGQSRPAKA